MTAPTIHQALAAVMADIGQVSKNDWNDHQKFKFRGIDALHNAVYGPLCKHGVFVAPEVIEAHYADVQTSQGKPSRQATLRVRYTFHGPAGDSVAVVSQGEAMDSGDKATPKALAVAFKYALLQTFVIPTQDQDDPDHHAPERGASQAPSSNGEASPKQVGMIKALVSKLPQDRQEAANKWLGTLGYPDGIGKRDASQAIDTLQKQVDA